MNNRGSFIKEMALRIAVVFIVLQSTGIILFARSIQGGVKDIFYIIGYEALLLLIILLIINSFRKRFENIMTGITKSLDEIKRGHLPVIVTETGYVETEGLRGSINFLFNRFKQLFSEKSQELKQVSSLIRKSGLPLDTISENMKKQNDLIKRLEGFVRKTDDYRRELLNTTQDLINLSEDNVSALTEITSSGGEIEEHTKQLLKSTTDIHSIILEIAKAVKEIAKNMENLSVSVEQTSVAVDELTASFKEIERNTKESANMTKGVRSIAAEGMSVIADAMDGMDKIAESVKRNVEMIQRLGEKSMEIEKILSVISDITKKTNLLSLNAAILSSQAGEEGKVFSVVADEIKLLADKTRASAKEITEIIKSTQSDIEATLGVSEESLKTVGQGTGLVVKAGEALREVINLARKSAESAVTIQKATHEQVMGISQINSSMEMIKSSVEDVTKATFMQEKGSRHILSESERIKEVSSNLMRGIEEQNRAVQLMLGNLQVASEKIKHIREIIGSEQSERELTSSIKDIEVISSKIINIIQDARDSFNKAYRETTESMKELEGFKGE
jgi:methyl-accepting chemotaxis protein